MCAARVKRATKSGTGPHTTAPARTQIAGFPFFYNCIPVSDANPVTHLMRIHNTMFYNNKGNFAFCNNIFDQVFHRIHGIIIRHSEQLVDHQGIIFNSECPWKVNPLLLSPGHWQSACIKYKYASLLCT